MNIAKAKIKPRREEIDDKYKWKLEDMYQSMDLWEKDFEKVKSLLPKIDEYRGRLSENGNVLLEALKLSDEISCISEKLYVYGRMKRDEDNTNPNSQSIADRVMGLYTKVNAALSFFVPEIIRIPEEILKDFILNVPDLKVYEFYLKEIIRQKKHVLSEKEEEILALASEIAQAPKDIFTMLNNADMKFPIIKDENNEDVELTNGNFIKFLRSKDRRVRTEAFHALYSSYIDKKNTLAATLSGSVKKSRFFATVRKYDSAIQASLDSDNIPLDVYDNLIKTVNDNMRLLHRYLRLRKKALKLDELHMYDLYVPIVDQPDKTIPYEEALEIVKEGVSPLGKEYIELLDNAFKSGWIDVYENIGKTSGAYSWGAYGTHPYVLLNYQGTLNDVFTIAHEMGHALHTHYTNISQPYINSGYKIFVAEVASTVNESLLMKYMLRKATDKQEKAYLMNMYLEEFRTTLFRQVMFAEFEKIIHQKAKDEEALTAEEFSNIYKGLNEKYYGAEVFIDSEISMEWSRIPHFYNSFYVYKYATGLSAASSISMQILEEGEPAVRRYIDFLKSGNSDYPLEILKKAGVDLSTPKPIEDAMRMFEGILFELEELIG
ncbi:MAG TPA: oligoendopeptidase F [Clostridiaceae bacterium]|nr:oligoendopeptidase F [Clostridiaceae bacterium]